MTLRGKTYDALKFIALVVLPALVVFVLTIGDLWGIPKVQEIAATIGALGIFLGSVLQVSSSRFNNTYDGLLMADGVDDDTGITNLKMVVTRPPEDIVDGKVARFKIGAPIPQQPAA